MLFTEQHKQEALGVLELLSAEQWEVVKKYILAITRPATPEEIERKRAAAEAEEKRKAEAQARRTASVVSFEEWAEKQKGSVRIPERYDIGLPELRCLCSYMDPYSLNTEEVFNGVCAVYEMGFKRGSACEKAAQKKGKAII